MPTLVAVAFPDSKNKLSAWAFRAEKISLRKEEPGERDSKNKMRT